MTSLNHEAEPEQAHSCVLTCAFVRTQSADDPFDTDESRPAQPNQLSSTDVPLRARGIPLIIARPERFQYCQVTPIHGCKLSAGAVTPMYTPPSKRRFLLT